MIIVPAVDVRRGRVVRLRRGQVGDETVYGSDPTEAALRWEAEGAERLHLVDLDAAIDAAPQNELIGDVIAALRIPVEVGGGLRTVEDARHYLEQGVDRVIFGTAAVSHAEVVQEAVATWPQDVVVALDARDGRTAIAGWNQQTAIDAVELAREVEGWGVARVQYTDIARDGTLVGPNLAAIARLGRRTGLRITASGGVSTVDDLRRLAALGLPGLDEAIVGRALYDRRFTLAEAIAAVCGPSGEEER